MKILLLIFLTSLIQNSSQVCRVRRPRPHIIVIMGDDMGHNDIGLRTNQIPTPNIDALGYNGVVLDRYYVQNACTPSRAAFLTGNYPIRSAMQGLPIVAGENRSLPLNMPLMPQHLKNLGYRTHIVGKWHLGSAYRSSTPTEKGFDSHFGYWNGFTGYYDYFTDFNSTAIEGFDLHDRFETERGYQGQYATRVFTERALDIIEGHNTTRPLFLLMTHLAAHAGRDGTELGVPNEVEAQRTYSYIQDPRRRLYAEIVAELDRSIGQVVRKLSERQMLENSIILFFSDNGAPTVGPYTNSGSNWPLRGIKLTNFEGGIRGTATIFSPLLKKRGYVNKELIHVSDWLPTFYAAAGGNLADLGPIDGVNQWPTLSLDTPSPRSEILVNINEQDNTTSIITDNGRFKLVTGAFEGGTYDGYFGDSGRSPDTPPYDPFAVLQSETNIAIQELTQTPITRQQIRVTRAQIDLSWCRNDSFRPPLNCSQPCLFDLENDPCETTNIIEENPEIAERLLRRIADFFEVLVPQGDSTIDPNANPQRYNNTWCTWLDDDWCVKTPNNTRLF
ncbi:arylsulfatase B precursor [Tribolium castaneum]|uniref:Arylsulfatase b n=1 Tax=Tribolium castaneum TaxID=7070 RepID=D2A5L8_TRICA|nr:arylsulfatase B precursor [Tribolium castaneum]AGQ03798.1 arylsulfatase b [Tribolium castaneum]EFA05056.1 Arylsulfatase B-like Protein [Tribolium castaneum]|eukprot:NP_001280526.1 arylsulfatase B precursor [Tribolium castaneum]